MAAIFRFMARLQRDKGTRRMRAPAVARNQLIEAK
jgi:hypothetical protein